MQLQHAKASLTYSCLAGVPLACHRKPCYQYAFCSLSERKLSAVMMHRYVNSVINSLGCLGR